MVYCCAVKRKGMSWVGIDLALLATHQICKCLISSKWSMPSWFENDADRFLYRIMNHQNRTAELSWVESVQVLLNSSSGNWKRKEKNSIIQKQVRYCSSKSVKSFKIFSRKTSQRIFFQKFSRLRQLNHLNRMLVVHQPTRLAVVTCRFEFGTNFENLFNDNEKKDASSWRIPYGLVLTFSITQSVDSVDCSGIIQINYSKLSVCRLSGSLCFTASVAILPW
jgi:hypothetical protein